MGITPACAGKSQYQSHVPVTAEDHPRVCGEKGRHDLRCAEHVGSPPRVRGKEHFNATLLFFAGITPACAGKRLKKALKNKDF